MFAETQEKVIYTGTLLKSLFLILFSSAVLFSQTINPDSLLLSLESTGKGNIARPLISNLRVLVAADPGRTYLLAETALLSDEVQRNAQLSYKVAGAKAECLISLSRHREAERLLSNTIEKASKEGQKEILGALYIQAGRNAALASNLQTAMEHYLTGLRIARETGDILETAKGYTHLAILYYILKDTKKALEYNGIAMETAAPLTDKSVLADIYTHELIILINVKNYILAMDYARKAEKIYIETGDLRGQAGAYENIALLYRFLNEDNKGFEYSFKSLELKKRINDVRGAAGSFANIGGALSDLKRYDESLVYLNEARRIRDSLNDLRGLVAIYKAISAVYEKKGDYKKSLEQHKLYLDYNDSLYSADNTRKIRELEAVYQAEKREEEIESLREINEKDSMIKIYLLITIVLLVLITAVTIIAYRNKQRSNKELDAVNRDLKKSKEELEKLNEELNFLIRDREKFFKIIAHDLRGPLFTLLGMVEIIAKERDGLSGEKFDYFARESYLLTQSLQNLLENLLSWATLDTGRIKVHAESFDLKAQIDGIISLNNSTAAKKSLTIRYSGDDFIDVHTDKEILNLIVRNLLSNAIKYSVAGGEINISAVRSGETVSLKIADSGEGIPEELMEDLFTNKIQPKRGTNNEKGTGLGLRLCKEMGDLLNASLSARNHAGGGAAFEVMIPVKYHPPVSDK
ncbi:MAG: tetratricopeptide repeat-containing sensor histidine kinase [Ignavibacteriaceae bacterium]|nr:tetratricopeptide repeat-containing sensor histidine kinase [Ignavibacteriaceae bacterium]